MAIKVLVVDDSSFFRRRVSEMLSGDARFKIVGAAADGREAVEKTRELKPDVITMDVEMPVMDGIEAVKRIMRRCPTPILMFSSLTREGAQATFDALEAGAVDYMPKNFEDISTRQEEVARLLRTRVWSIGVRGLPSSKQPARTVAMGRGTGAAAGGKGFSLAESLAAVPRCHRLVAIGSSTGGPVAIQEILQGLPKNYPLPIVMVQHMPKSFTTAFAERLNRLCQIEVREAVDGDELRPGLALLAPGGMQMLIRKRGTRMFVKLEDATTEQNYKPCVDITFQSIADAGIGSCLAMILTGMGADGREGARALKSKGATIWAQDEATSVIYGMPMAVTKAGLTDHEIPLKEIAPALLKVS